MITPTSMVAGGDAIGRDADGRVMFIAGALPGERVEVEIVETHRDFQRARAVNVVEASPLRVRPPCPELTRGCGGCQWQHIDVEGQRALKAQIVTDALRRQARINDVEPQPTVVLDSDGYRTTVRAAVVGGRAGYRQLASHDTTAVDSCMVAHPLIEDLLTRGHYGDAAEVLLRCGARTGERMAATTPTDISIDVAGDVARDYVHEEVGGRRWRVSADSFFQGRPDGADALVALVVDAAAGRAGHAVDLYSGVGLFAGVLADRGWRVTAVEGEVSAIGDARANLVGADCTIMHADVAKWTPAPADLVVADPSRAGLRRAGVDVVVATGARRVVLVSCDAAALGRDAGLLISAGYTLTALTPVDMFPHTFHVEVVSVFDLAV